MNAEKKALKALVKLLDDYDSRVRFEAARELLEHSRPAPYTAYVAPTKTDE